MKCWLLSHVSYGPIVGLYAYKAEWAYSAAEPIIDSCLTWLDADFLNYRIELVGHI